MKAVEVLATSTVATGSYDSTKWNIGTLIRQKTGVNPEDNYIGPYPVSFVRPAEESTVIASMFPYVIDWSSTIQWVFLVENVAGATAARRVILYEYNKTLNTFNWKGFITMTLPTATAHTQRSLRVARYLHTTGTVEVSGTGVTGTSTQFTTERIGVGARIGFGSTDPTAITTWYIISAIGSDTGLTLSTSAGTIAAGTSYVIEELRPMIVTTNATVANGGLFIAKGINYQDFTPSGTTIAASAAGTDNLKLVYKISDASTTTIQVGSCLMLDDEVSKTEHYGYIITGTTTCIVYKINVRAADTITTGQMVLTGANIVITGTQAVTGTNSLTNNGRIATTGHGAGSGVKSIYFVTTTRIYRAALSNITAGNITWQSDNRVEIPPGGTSTIGATSVMAAIEYMGTIDKFIISTTGAVRNYITQYPTTSGDAFDLIWGINSLIMDAAAASSDRYTSPVNTIALPFSCWSESGYLFVVRNSATATLTQMYCIPFNADARYHITTSQQAITPEISTPNNDQFVRAYVNNVEYVGESAFEVPVDHFKMYYRVSGISDNSGGWTLLNKRNDLDITGASSIQFKFVFCTISAGLCISPRILGVTVLYNDLTTDSHYLPCSDLSSKTNKQFAWKFQTAFGGTVPTLRVRLYNAITDGLLDDDDSLTPTGTWEKSTNGTSWSGYDTSDKANDTTFIRFTPASLADNIQVRALLTQL